jgi:mono/diheme cytochrome c family protein
MTIVWLAWLLAGPPGGATTPAESAKPPVDLIWLIGRPIDEPLPLPPRPSPRIMGIGRALYASRCAGCHGERGNGDGPFAAGLRVPPTDFSKGMFKLRSTPSGALPTDGDLFRTLTRGHHGTAMLPATELAVEQRWALVYHVKTLCSRFHDEPPRLSVRVPPPPAETAELRARGHALYHQLRCVSCHGDAGAGDGPAAPSYAASDKDRPVRIRDFTRGRFIRGAELADIYLTLSTGLDGTPMGSYGALPPPDLWALAAYVRDLVRERPLREFPPAARSAAR